MTMEELAAESNVVARMKIFQWRVKWLLSQSLSFFAVLVNISFCQEFVDIKTPATRDRDERASVELAQNGPPRQKSPRKQLSIDASDWRSYNYSFNGWRYNVAENHLSPQNVSRLEVKWQFPPRGSTEKIGAINATPSVVNGYVYFGTSTFPKFYKLKPNGQIEWTYTIGERELQPSPLEQRMAGLVPRDGIYSSALVTADSVYFGDVSGVAYCLDRSTGKELWKVNSKGPNFPGAHHANMIMASPVLIDGKIVFAGGAYEHTLPTDKEYECCYGRGFVMALEPESGAIIWKYDVGPEPQKYDPPVTMRSLWGTRTFHYGPSTSSVWSTPSYDPESNTVFFGTDVHNSPRKPTEADPRNYTPHSAAVIALDASTGREKWVTQTNKNDIWNHTMPSYDSKTGYKDQSIGDTPKVLSADFDGRTERFVGTGSKNGGFYAMRISDGEILAHTPLYTGRPSTRPDVDPRTLALPSPIGGLQTGCATDGRSVFTNGIDNIYKGTSSLKILSAPTGGRVTSISTTTKDEHWRHERPKVKWIGGTEERPLFRNTGDPVASGIAVANGCLFFTTFSSNKLVALNASTGEVLNEIYLGPVLAGPSVSRGRVYIGTGNTQFIQHESEAYFPKSTTGTLFSFGLPGEDEVSKLGDGNE